MQNQLDQEFVRLTGKTRKGKNRLYEHGSIWKVLRKAQFNKDAALFIQSLKDSNHVRWVLLNQDDDFSIEEFKSSIE